MAEPVNLAAADVDNLAADSSAAARADTAGKVARQLSNALTEGERRLAEDIIRTFLRDTEASVRGVLAECLKTSSQVPHDVAMGLAKDIADVSVPFVQFSQVLSDDDLIAIIAENGVHTQVAIAKRQTVSEPVSAALVSKGHDEVVAALVSNEGARISEATLGDIVAHHGGNVRVAEALAVRPKMPIALAERLMHGIFDNLWTELAGRRALPEDVVSDLVLQARERATVALLPAEAARYDVEALVGHLQAHQRLTPSIILRAVCMGDVRFLESALAKLADIPLENARKLIEDQSGVGLERLILACGLPDKLVRVFRIAISIASETGYDGGPNDRERYRHRVTERILTNDEPLIAGSDLEYLISRLARPPQPPAAA